ncbi:MAG: CaiB/BaiF CoA transferase family protein [Thermodesulfobacteriota bacterium]
MRPLDGIRVIEMAGIAPSPFCGMILADFGADVTVVDRPSKGAPEIPNVMDRNPFDRGKKSIRIDLKEPEGRGIVRNMMRGADVLLEGYRPGVMERLNLGPQEVFVENPGLVYARLTGWGQYGPLAATAGHDIDYIAVSGALSLFRREGEPPIPPSNVLGDFAGGGLLCALGILLALTARQRTGEGQVVDAAMMDGASYLCTQFYGLLANRLMTLNIGTNILDGGAPYYRTYETADGEYMAVGAIEERFYRELIDGLGLAEEDLPEQNDKAHWPEMQTLFAGVFRTRTREEWTRVFEDRDACVAPVMGLDEVEGHPHAVARGLITRVDGVSQPAPAPRLSATPGRAERAGSTRGAESRKVLEDLGMPPARIEALFQKGVVE